MRSDHRSPRSAQAAAVGLLSGLALLLGSVSVSHPQLQAPPAGGPRRDAQRSAQIVQGSYYLPEHLHWYASSADKRREKRALFSLLSTKHAVVGFTWTPATQASAGPKRGRLTQLLQKPPANLPPVVDANQCDAGPTHTAFLLTFRGDLEPGRMLSALNALRGLGVFDFVSPVFYLPDKMAYAFPEFEAEFLPPALIVDGEATIRRFNAANQVTVVSISDNRYTLEIRPDSPSNVLATALRYIDTPWLVKSTTLTWRSVIQPISVDAKLETPNRLPAVDVRDPVGYVVTIDRDHAVTVLPEMTSQTEAKNWLLKAVGLPEEVVDVKEVTRSTRALNSSREQDVITFVFLFSKAGRYDLPPFELKYSVTDGAGVQKVETISTERTFRLTVDEHLPRDIVGLPGDVFLAPTSAPGLPFRLGLIGSGTLVAGAVLLAVAGAPALLSWWRAQRARRIAARAQRTHGEGYRTLWQRVEHAAPHLALGDPEVEKTWLRDTGKAVRGLLGDRLYHDETALLGGLGSTTHELQEIVQARAGESEAPALAPAITVLDEIEQIVDVAEPRLTMIRVMDIRERVSRLMNGTST